MKKILLISDTHGFLDPRLLKHIEWADEIWHAGDIGNAAVLHALEDMKPVRAVYGNIDGTEVRKMCPLDQHFVCEGLEVWITHIGGYPGKYEKRVLAQFMNHRPGIFICGHSHILKVIYDKAHDLLHINPGAAGNHGIHRVVTAIRMEIDQGKVKDLSIVEWPRKGLA
ncbi:MAG: metallophosphoesterase family protein [Flavobacteriales bacterium]|nr:metallophosphoesterase family protein [Flavobacteriales bacterium]MCB9448778.1 metallophosphoesterase family protein [Flavobacteriales bacterium]